MLTPTPLLTHMCVCVCEGGACAHSHSPAYTCVCVCKWGSVLTLTSLYLRTRVCVCVRGSVQQHALWHCVCVISDMAIVVVVKYHTCFVCVVRAVLRLLLQQTRFSGCCGTLLNDNTCIHIVLLLWGCKRCTHPCRCHCDARQCCTGLLQQHLCVCCCGKPVTPGYRACCNSTRVCVCCCGKPCCTGVTEACCNAAHVCVCVLLCGKPPSHRATRLAATAHVCGCVLLLARLWHSVTQAPLLQWHTCVVCAAAVSPATH